MNSYDFFLEIINNTKNFKCHFTIKSYNFFLNCNPVLRAKSYTVCIRYYVVNCFVLKTHFNKPYVKLTGVIKKANTTNIKVEDGEPVLKNASVSNAALVKDEVTKEIDNERQTDGNLDTDRNVKHDVEAITDIEKSEQMDISTDIDDDDEKRMMKEPDASDDEPHKRSKDFNDDDQKNCQPTIIPDMELRNNDSSANEPELPEKEMKTDDIEVLEMEQSNVLLDATLKNTGNDEKVCIILEVRYRILRSISYKVCLLPTPITVLNYDIIKVVLIQEMDGTVTARQRKSNSLPTAEE